MFRQYSEHIVDDASVQSGIVQGVDEDVVHVNGDVPFVDQVAKNEIHHGLECGWCIGKAEEHHHRFEKASIGFKGSFPLVAIVDVDVIISPLNV